MSNLEQTQPGDQVIVTAYYSRSPSAVVQTVERVTKSQVVTEDGNRFARRTGIRVGSSGSISPLLLTHAGKSGLNHCSLNVRNGISARETPTPWN